MTASDLAAVQRALAEVAQTQHVLNEAERTLAARTGQLADLLASYGATLQEADQPPDKERQADLIRNLYWDAPSLHNKVVADAFALRTPNDVPAIAGPREFDLPCVDCGTPLPHVVKNRTQLADLRRTTRCGPCTDAAAKRAEHARALADIEHHRRNREHAEIIDRAMVAYVQSHPDMLDDPDDVGFYLDIPVPEWGVSTVSLAELNKVRRRLEVTLRTPPHAT